MKLLSSLLLFLSTTLAAEWQVLYPNVMTIAIGVSAPDENNVYVSGADDGSGAAILRSEDGGNTWRRLPHDPQMMYLDISLAPFSSFGASPGIGIFGLVSGSSFTQDGEVFQSTPDEPFLFVSQSVVSTDSQTFYMTGAFQERVVSDYADGVVASFDGGKSLRYFDWGLGTPARYGSFPSNSTWFISGGTWPAENRLAKFGHQGIHQLSSRVNIHKKGDGRFSTEVLLEKEGLGSSEGYIGVIGKTTDGGKTFQKVFEESGRMYFNGISCPDETNCWVVGEGPGGAWILHSSDGGGKWEEQYYSAEGGLFAVEMISKNEGWAVGASITVVTFNALFLHTQDGGRTWVETDSVPNAYPNAIHVLNRERAYATAFLRNGLSSILGYQ